MARNNIDVKILADARGFKSGVTEAESALGKFTSNVTRLAGPAIAGGLVAAGAGLVALGDKFDSAYDSIQTATGATGDKLKGLQDSFNDVLASGPYAFDGVASAIGDLNQRLDITGQPLEDLSQQFLDLSRLTGTDVSTNIETITRTMAKFGVPAEDMSSAMDELFRASQATGISVDDLSSQMTRFGAPLQQLGFSFDESAALLGTFEENGINTTQAMRGMRQSFDKLKRPGETAQQTFRRIIHQIADIRDPARRSAAAVEAFGTTAGPELANAIASGTFSIDDLVDSISNGTSTISGTAAATDDWREKLATLKNKVMVGLAPLADDAFSAITDGLVAVSDWFTVHWPDIKAGFVAFGRGFNKYLIKPAEAVVSWFQDNWATISDVVTAVFDTISDYVSVPVDAIKGLVKTFADLFRGDWSDAWKAFKDTVVKVVDDVIDFLGDLGSLVVDGIGPLAGWLVDKGAELLRGLKDGIVNFWNNALYPWLKKLPGKAVDAVGALLETLYDKGTDLLRGLKNGIVKFWDHTLLPWLKKLPNRTVSAVGSLLKTLYAKGRALLGGLKDGAVNFWDDTAYPWLKSLPGKAVSAVGDVLETLYAKGRALLGGFRNGALHFWKDIVLPWLQSLPSKAVSGVGDVLETLYAKGRALLGGFRNGIVNFWKDDVLPWLQSLPGKAVSAVGDVLETLYAKGRALLGGFRNGISHFWNDDVKPLIESLPGRAKSAIGDVTETLWRKGWDLVSGLFNGAVSFWDDNVAGWLSDFPSRVVNAVGDLGGVLYGIGRDIIHGLWNGLRDFWNEHVVGWLSSIGGIIRNLKGPPSKDAKLLVENGELIMGGLNEGLRRGWGDTARLLSGMTATINATPGRASVAGVGVTPIIGGGEALSRADFTSNPSAGGRGGNHTTNIYIPVGVTARNVTAATRRYERLNAA